MTAMPADMDPTVALDGCIRTFFSTTHEEGGKNVQPHELQKFRQEIVGALRPQALGAAGLCQLPFISLRTAGTRS